MSTLVGTRLGSRYRLEARIGQGGMSTVYRALDFLREQGLVHKIERLNAFIPCAEADHRHHAAQFLICRTCGRVVEMQDPDVASVLARAAKDAGFSISNATIEAEGLCSTCRSAAATRARSN